MNSKGKIQMEHVYHHPPSSIWRALTDPKLHAQWWAAGDVKAEVGHQFELDMGVWGKQPCEVVRVEKERLLEYRFAAETLGTLITWELFPEGTGTRLRLTQVGFNMDSPMGRQAYEGMKKGWPTVLARIADVFPNK